MKILKNHSEFIRRRRTNYFVIFGLALALLFFAGCGKKDNTDEIKLPLEIKQVKKVAQKRPPKKLPKLQTPKNENTRPVIIKVYENGFPSKNATVKVKKPTTKLTRKLSWWTAETDEDGNAEISIPSKWKYLSVVAQKGNYALVTFYTNNLTPGSLPIYVDLNLDEQGVIITAELIANKKINDESEDVFAKITSDLFKAQQSLYAASSTACKDNKIIFLPIIPGLKRMKILVEVGEFAKSYSDYFDTLDGTNKTIQVNMLEGVTLYGRTIRKDGTPITNVYFRATPRGLYENSRGIGHVNSNIKTDIDGNFVINKLLPEHYKLHITANEGDYMVTNVILYSDVENKMEFIFPNIEYRTSKGVVKYEETDEPAEGIEIKCESRLRNGIKKTSITDSEGGFEISLPISRYNTYSLTINEPGYAKIKKIINKNDPNKLLTLFLRETGIITGKITNEEGEPLSGIKVAFISIYKNKFWDMKRDYSPKSEFPSNGEGVYVISNAAAPETYMLDETLGNNDYLISDDYLKKSIKVNQGEMTTFDFTMLPQPKIKIKLIDENENAILRYKLQTRTQYSRGQSVSSSSVSLEDENEWYNVNIWMRNKKATISLNAETEDGRCAVTNDIEITSDEIYEIILRIDSGQSPDVAGFVYNYDMIPVVDKYILAYADPKEGNAETDHLGFFEIIGMNLKKGTTLQLNIWKDNITYSTNVLAGSDNIEWILPKLNNITGRVFIENLDTPATNFAVSVIFQSSKKHFQSADGSFSTPMKYLNNDEKFKVYISADDYAVVVRKINPKDINTFDLGDIILANKPATISGKVIDQYNNPLGLPVILINSMRKSVASTNSKKSDGSYKFSNVLPGKYYVITYVEQSTARSEYFELVAEENLIVPDLEIEIPDATISGTVTLDGVLLNNKRLLFKNGNTSNETKIRNGKFELKISPGKYAVSCKQKKVAAIVNLTESNNNIINFKSGTETIEFELPFENDWRISLTRRINNINLSVAIVRIHYGRTRKVDKIQDGEYIITAYCRGNDNKTNITVKSTIKSGETKKIRF